MFIDFPLDSIENSKEKLEKIIEENKKALAFLLAIKEKTFLNFMRPLAELDEKISMLFTPISHLNSVCDSEKSREAFSSCLTPLTIYSTELSQNKDIYEAVLEIEKDKNLTKEQRKVVENNLRTFRLSGVHLEEDKKNRLKEINIRLSELSDQFSKNVLDDTNAFELILKDDTDIKPMPEADKNIYKTESGYKFTLQAPSYIALMTYCTNRELRKDVYLAYMNRGKDNGKIIEEILSLKDEKAHILGYDNYRNMRNETMSAPSITEVLNFLEGLAKRAKPYGLKELEELSNFALKKGIEKVESYDTAYLSNLLKKEVLGFDSELLRPYLERNNVIAGLILFLEKLFHISFKEVTNTPIWHNTVKCYDLHLNDKPFARIYFDLEARIEKRGGAWMNNFQTGRLTDKGERVLPSAFIVANFPKSTKENPSLLRHDDVHTLFHEAGHAIHHLFSKCEEAEVSGVNGVEWDAIEFPSQFLENFSYEPSVLSLFAKHYETEEEMPKELIEKLIQNKNFQAGFFLLRQLEFGIFDLKLHDKPHNKEEVKEILNSVRKDVAVIFPPSNTAFENAFSHIFAGGYSAGYYSYKWAEMLSADLYIEFSNHNVFNDELSNAYKKEVLEKGGSDRMLNLYHNIMNREPNRERLLELSGLN